MVISAEEKNKPVVLTDYDPDKGFEKMVLIVHNDGTVTGVPKEEV